MHIKYGQKMYFGTFLDMDGHFFNTVNFPNNAPIYPFRGEGYYLIQGRVVEEFGFASIEVLKFAKLPIFGNLVMEYRRKENDGTIKFFFRRPG